MMRDEVIEEIKLLGTKVWAYAHPNSKEEIKRRMKLYATAYYEGQALITDRDFEKLIDVLKVYDAFDPYLTTPGWGYEIENGVNHIYGKVGTLPYYFDYKDVEKQISDCDELMVTPKLDGINFVAYYKDGRFEKCATRGNGRVGKDISWAYDATQQLPKSLQSQTFAFNGEAIYFDSEDRKPCSRDIVAAYLNTKKQINKKIKFMPFGLLNSSMNYFQQISEINKMISPKINFELFKNLPSSRDLRELYEEYSKIFQIDGLVITDKEKEIQLAYKFME